MPKTTINKQETYKIVKECEKSLEQKSSLQLGSFKYKSGDNFSALESAMHD